MVGLRISAELRVWKSLGSRGVLELGTAPPLYAVLFEDAAPPLWPASIQNLQHWRCLSEDRRAGQWRAWAKDLERFLLIILAKSWSRISSKSWSRIWAKFGFRILETFWLWEKKVYDKDFSKVLVQGCGRQISGLGFWQIWGLELRQSLGRGFRQRLIWEV